MKDKFPAQEPVITNGKGERGCLLDGGNGILHVKKKEGSPGGWKIYKEASITQYCSYPVEHNREKKYKISGRCNSQADLEKKHFFVNSKFLGLQICRKKNT